MFVAEPEQDLAFALLRVDLEQIDAFDAGLVDHVRERAQITGHIDVPQPLGEQTVEVLLLRTAPREVFLCRALVAYEGVQDLPFLAEVAEPPGHDRQLWVVRERGRARRFGESAREQPGVDPVQPGVEFQHAEQLGYRLERVDHAVGTRAGDGEGEEPDVGADVEDAGSALRQHDPVPQILVLLEDLAVQEVRLRPVGTGDGHPVGQRVQFLPVDETGLFEAAQVPQCAGPLGIRYEIGGQTRLARPVGHRRHHRFGDCVVPCQRRLDLAEFDAYAPHLDLVVATAGVVQDPVRVPAGEVSGAVHPAAVGTVRIGYEALRRQCRPVDVATGELEARDVELARHSGRDPAQLRVQDVQSGVRDRGSDGDRAWRVAGATAPVGHVHRGLGGPVEIVQFGIQDAEEPRPQLTGERLAAREHPAQ